MGFWYLQRGRHKKSHLSVAFFTMKYFGCRMSDFGSHAEVATSEIPTSEIDYASSPTNSAAC